jgi:RNA polymerase sigma factor for flagellar operon FliA
MEEYVRKLWDRYLSGPTEELRDDIVVSYLPLVRYVLGRLSTYLPAILDEEDLNACGVIGLIKAVEDYDPERKTEFTTFAVPKIRGAILDELRKHDWIPRSARKKASIVGEAFAKLAEEKGEPPNNKELADELELSLTKLDKLLAEISFASFLSLEGMGSGADDDDPLLDPVATTDGESPHGIVETHEDVELLAETITSLPYQERIVITLYYQQDLMLKEIAKILRVSKSRVSQIHNKALLTLRSKLRVAQSRRRPGAALQTAST